MNIHVHALCEHFQMCHKGNTFLKMQKCHKFNKILNPFNSEIFQFFALIYNKLGGTYVTLPSQVLIQYLKLIHMHGCVYI